VSPTLQGRYTLYVTTATDPATGSDDVALRPVDDLDGDPAIMMEYGGVPGVFEVSFSAVDITKLYTVYVRPSGGAWAATAQDSLSIGPAVVENSVGSVAIVAGAVTPSKLAADSTFTFTPSTGSPGLSVDVDAASGYGMLIDLDGSVSQRGIFITGVQAAGDIGLATAITGSAPSTRGAQFTDNGTGFAAAAIEAVSANTNATAAAYFLAYSGDTPAILAENLSSTAGASAITAEYGGGSALGYAIDASSVGRVIRATTTGGPALVLEGSAVTDTLLLIDGLGQAVIEMSGAYTGDGFLFQSDADNTHTGPFLSITQDRSGTEYMIDLETDGGRLMQLTNSGSSGTPYALQVTDGWIDLATPDGLLAIPAGNTPPAAVPDEDKGWMFLDDDADALLIRDDAAWKSIPLGSAVDTLYVVVPIRAMGTLGANLASYGSTNFELLVLTDEGGASEYGFYTYTFPEGSVGDRTNGLEVTILASSAGTNGADHAMSVGLLGRGIGELRSSSDYTTITGTATLGTNNSRMYASTWAFTDSTVLASTDVQMHIKVAESTDATTDDTWVGGITAKIW
jgi:hypothetical protein